jgi:acyl carrier protein
MVETRSLDARVRPVLQMQVGVMPEATGEEATLREDLDADGFNCIEVAMAFEEAFGIDGRDLLTSVTLPPSIFALPQLSTTITIADAWVQDLVIDVEARATALRDAFDVYVRIKIDRPETAG